MTKKQYKRYAMKALRTFKAKYVPDKKMITDRISTPKWGAIIFTGPHTYYDYPKTQRYTYKSYRVFASNELQDGRILKCGGSRGKPEKFADTPDHCFIYNDDVNGVKVPQNLDKQWYIDLAKRRLKQFGIAA